MITIALGLTPLLQVLFVLVVIGVGLWLIETYVPMAPPIKVIIRVVLVLVLVWWLLHVFGVM